MTRTAQVSAKKSGPRPRSQFGAGIPAEGFGVSSRSIAPGLEHLASVQPQHARRQVELTFDKARVSGNRCMAGPVEGGQHTTLTDDAGVGVRIFERRDQGMSPLVPRATFDSHRPLSGSGQHHLGIEHGGRAIGKAKPVQSRQRQQGRHGFAAIDLRQPRVHVAPEHDDFEIAAAVHELGAATLRRSTDHRSPRKRRDVVHGGTDESIARIFPRQNTGNRNTVRQNGFEVLHGVHGDVDIASEQRLLDLLGEQTLAANIGERAVGYAIARGADDDELHVIGREVGMGSNQSGPDLPGLDEGELAAAGADAHCRAAFRTHLIALRRHGQGASA